MTAHFKRDARSLYRKNSVRSTILENESFIWPQAFGVLRISKAEIYSF